jgi:hypothetical protein
MGIATVKYDAFNCPKQEKYRIVVLGNINHHSWSKEFTAALVMSQLELLLLTSMTFFIGGLLKIVTVSRCLCNLPYMIMDLLCDPSSWVSSFCTWYLLVTNTQSVWLTSCSSIMVRQIMFPFTCYAALEFRNSPCIFVGNLIEGVPPIYVSSYVHDIIYFSPSCTIEKHLEFSLSTIGNITLRNKLLIFWV